MYSEEIFRSSLLCVCVIFLVSRIENFWIFSDAIYCPSNVSLFNVTSKTVYISWQDLNADFVPGGLSSYAIFYRIDHVGFPPGMGVANTWSNRTIFLLEGLEESVIYWISVRAFVDVSAGNLELPQCREYNITTKDDGMQYQITR